MDGFRKALLPDDIVFLLDVDNTLLDNDRVLIAIHEEQMLDDVERRHPARHYVIVDDKGRILAAMKRILGRRRTTVFPRQGHYSLDPHDLSTYPQADLAIEGIADLCDCEFPAMFGADRPVDGEVARDQETI